MSFRGPQAQMATFVHPSGSPLPNHVDHASAANYKIGLNSGILKDFDTMPACTTSSSFSFIRLSTGWSKNFDLYEI
jgi:hypothetical protein